MPQPTVISQNQGSSKYGVNPQSFVMGSANRNKFDQKATDAQNRPAPRMSGYGLGAAKTYGGATIDQQPQGQFRQGQAGLAQALQGRMDGTAGPSVAELQQKQGIEAGIRAAASRAASNPGLSPGIAARMASEEQRGLISDASRMGGMLRAQEQATAQGQLGQVLQGARGADIGLATSQAGMEQAGGMAGAAAHNQMSIAQGQLNQQIGQANLDANLANQAQNDQMASFYMSQGFSRDEAQQKAYAEMERIMSQDRATAAGVRTAQAANDTDRRGQNMQMAGSIIGGAGSLLASDETAKHKEDRSRTSSEINDFLDKLDNASYEYKDEKHGKGRKWGIMAQSAENSDVGRSFVSRDKEDGILKLDSNMALSAVLASVKDIHERTKSLEGAA